MTNAVEKNTPLVNATSGEVGVVQLVGGRDLEMAVHQIPCPGYVRGADRGPDIAAVVSPLPTRWPGMIAPPCTRNLDALTLHGIGNLCIECAEDGD